VSDVSASEVLVTSFTLDGEGTAINISKSHKVNKAGELENKINEEIGK
jgi:hypothetical protein